MSGQEVTASVFAAAPRELVRAVSLQQTVEMVRLAVDIVEAAGRRSSRPTPAAAQWLRETVLRYTRELAFAAAHVYASAAEVRGAWDARLEALVVDGLVRGDASRDAALPDDGARLARRGRVVAMAGRLPGRRSGADPRRGAPRRPRPRGRRPRRRARQRPGRRFVGSPGDPRTAAAALAPASATDRSFWDRS